MNILEAKYVTKEVIEDSKCYNMITGGWQDNNPHILSDKALNRRSESIRKAYQNKELLLKLKEKSKKLWEDPEYADKVVSGMKKFYEAHPEKLIEKGKKISEILNDSDHKEKHDVQCKEAIAKGRAILKEKMNDPNFRRSDSQYILCITTNEIYPTLAKAVKCHGSIHIMDVCKGVRKYTKDKLTGQKLEWKFIDEEEYKRRSE